MNGTRNQPNEIVQFRNGASLAGVVITIEFLIFVFEQINNLMPSISANLPKSSTYSQYSLNFSWFIGLFILITIIQSILVGFTGTKGFIAGFLLVEGIYLVLFIMFVLNVIPSVVYGMAISFLIVLACLIIRLHLEAHQRNSPWDE
ncbi:MAG: hypothetical protein ABSE07_06465 [Methanoregula sp.]|jgi:hypothetical protein